MWGTPQRSRRISIAPPRPGILRVPFVLGSDRRNTWYQRPAPVLAASPQKAAPARANRFATAPAVIAGNSSNAGRSGRSVAEPLGQPALGLELLQVGVHGDRGHRTHLGGDVV